jgi:hypothetical protein
VRDVFAHSLRPLASPQEAIQLANAMARARDWKESAVAIDKASRLGFHNGTSQLFAAIAQQQLGNHDHDRILYEAACRSIDQHEPNYEPIGAVRKEADELIKSERIVSR